MIKGDRRLRHGVRDGRKGPAGGVGFASEYSVTDKEVSSGDVVRGKNPGQKPHNSRFVCHLCVRVWNRIWNFRYTDITFAGVLFAGLLPDTEPSCGIHSARTSKRVLYGPACETGLTDTLRPVTRNVRTKAMRTKADIAGNDYVEYYPRAAVSRRKCHEPRGKGRAKRPLHDIGRI